MILRCWYLTACLVDRLATAAAHLRDDRTDR